MSKSKKPLGSARKKKAAKKKATKKAAPDVDSICPDCGPDGKIVNDKCGCGNRKAINQVSGNVIWMKNGRVVKAFRDSRDAYIQMAQRHGIPEDQWPKEFRG